MGLLDTIKGLFGSKKDAGQATQPTVQPTTDPAAEVGQPEELSTEAQGAAPTVVNTTSAAPAQPEAAVGEVATSATVPPENVGVTEQQSQPDDEQNTTPSASAPPQAPTA